MKRIYNFSDEVPLKCACIISA